MDWDELRTRIVTAPGDVALGAPALTVALVAAVLALTVPPVWQVLRLAVTLVHELGHALVGLAVGRRFTGFVLRGDMSGHAVTVGPARGPGRVVTTWAGYPAPAVVGAGLVWTAGRGWAAPVLTVVLVVWLVVLVRVRSLLTALVMLVAIALTGALWWWRDDSVQAQVLVATGIVLLVGAWRHLGAVMGSRTRGSDPAVLASLTPLPRAVWTGSFVLVCAAASALAAVEVAAGWR
ncbi:Peptidase M50B-like [Pedococcus dokdonensis]|uniref:Peptidase M50B-like n=1 Tax=Pedococcus dokdonensis TaxID=443156 RepID=A0A1H0RJY2_9MICO|nr:M50 family metallopeptidase [Pedococcus dokdonensis]SDP29852.1 Peptidase M50B-like [Pedococcus dokdonensis]